MTTSVPERIARYDWSAIEDGLNKRGYATLPGLLSAAECNDLAALYDEDRLFRSRVVMSRHAFGEGEYKYFTSPLPGLVEDLRHALYPTLATVARNWSERLKLKTDYPEALADYLSRCHDAGQTRPTPLLLKYLPEGYNCLHQDLYGALAFPLQVAVQLRRPAQDFEGGAFLLVEQRPRAQSRGEAIVLAQGEAIVFPNAIRPVAGQRGDYRVNLRHGVSRVTAGERMTLGLIFHDAQ